MNFGQGTTGGSASRQEHLDVWFRTGPDDHASALRRHNSVLEGGSAPGNNGTTSDRRPSSTAGKSSPYFCSSPGPGSKSSFRGAAEQMGTRWNSDSVSAELHRRK